MISSLLKRMRHRRFLRAFLVISGTGLLSAVCVMFLYQLWALKYDLKGVGQIPERSVVYDKDDELYSRIGNENRIVVPLDKVSKHFVPALLAREDSRFYQHHGIDLYGIGRAFVKNLASLSVKEGGSTLTQQLARNSFSLGKQNLHRKLLEAMVARRIEKFYTKQQIIEAYVNRIYFGAGVYGIETASQSYFGKPSMDLTLGESALLAGIIRSPNRFSPFRNFEAALNERDTVLDRMVKLEMITEDEAKKAKSKKISIIKKRPLPYQENYAMDAIRREMDAFLPDDEGERGGFKIYTTLDAKLQVLGEQSIAIHLAEVENRKGYTHPKKGKAEVKDPEAPTEYLQGALIAIDHRTGGIRALAGGRDYRESRYDRAMLARRQIGSSFKPFIYTAAFQEGLSPDEKIDDGPIPPGEFNIVGAKTWSPVNSDGKNAGIQPAEYGLIHSRNTMTVRVAQRIGIDRIHDLAVLLGLGKEEDIPKVPSICLGSFETTLKDLTAAYTVFPNRGMYCQPFIIRKIEDVDGEVIYQASPNRFPVFERGATSEASDVLEQVIERGTAASAGALGLNRRAGGKTGTTNDYKDAWFIGYTHSLTCGVWVGFDKPKTIMDKAYGSTLALPIWVRMVSRASEDDYPDGSLDASDEWEGTGGVHAQKEKEKEGDDFFSKVGRSLGKLFGN
jgi:penicillin-binding protein 1A